MSKTIWVLTHYQCGELRKTLEVKSTAHKKACKKSISDQKFGASTILQMEY